MRDTEYIMSLEQSVDSLEYQLEQKEEEIQRLQKGIGEIAGDAKYKKSMRYPLNHNLILRKCEELLGELKFKEQGDG